MCGCRRDAATWCRRKLRDEEFHDWCSLRNVITVIPGRIGGGGGDIWHVLGRAAYRVLVGKREGKSPLGRPRHRWKDSIKVDVKGIGCEAWFG